MKDYNFSRVMHQAKANKNDEFYTRLVDIERELEHYWPQLEGKKILCPCDSQWSAFYTYFNSQKYLHKFEIKFSYKDFRENEEMFEWADVVITNPPFSLFRDFFDTLIKYNNKFLVIAPITCAHYINIYPYIKNNTVKNGYYSVNNFINHEQQKVKAPGIWLTNMVVDRKFRDFDRWDDQKFVKYDDYDAYETVWWYGERRFGKASYPRTDKLLGVPVSFLNQFNSDQYEIVDTISPTIRGKQLFQRFVVRLKDN